MSTIIKTSITFLKTEDGFRATSIITGEVFGIGKTEDEAKNNLFDEFNKLSDENAVGEMFKHPYNCKITTKKFALTEV